MSLMSKRGLSVLLLTLSVGACGWFKSKPEYEGAELAKPMTVPADLSRPSDRDAMRIPAKSLIGANAVRVESVRSVDVGGDVASVWKRAGDALAAVEGAEILSRAESIASYEVRFAGETFLVSVQANGAGSRIIAVGVDGAASESAAAGQLLGLLKAKL